MEKEIGFAIPGMYENFIINRILINLKRDYPYCFYDNIKFDAFFGNFQYCLWDGGRVFTKYQHATIEQIKEIQSFYNEKHHLPIRFIYTNNQLSEKDLTDKFCNLVTEYCENDLNEIVVNSPLLEDYLRNKYPKYKFISSTTKCLKNKTDATDELNLDYYKVCLDYNLNYNLDFLKSLSQEQKNKVEFLINPICGANCQNRQRHYKLNSIGALNFGKKFHLDYCNIAGSNLLPIDSKKRNQLSIDDIFTTYVPMGFYSYKLEGRTFAPATHLENCVKYLIKPEYQPFFNEVALAFYKGETGHDSYY